ncbi:MAG TPA: MerR family transcriptional regulator [Gemmatimonadales bacterium]|nr:MerR family transcriptional regulator [Gemmatimonadales bacterium]
MSAGLPPADPLATLRSYRTLAPWGLQDLAALAGAILEASDVVPLSGAAQARPSVRTIRFYLSRHLVDGPEGRGTAAVYGYRHLLQVLAIKLRQMEGMTLAAIIEEGREQTGDAIERRVASTIGPALPPPELLGWTSRARGRSGRMVAKSPGAMGAESAPGTLRRIPVATGVDLLVSASHPALRRPDAEAVLAQALRTLLERLEQGVTD